MTGDLTYEFHIEALNGRVIRIEKADGTGAMQFAEFALPSLNRDQQLRIKIYSTDDPADPVGTILLKR